MESVKRDLAEKLTAARENTLQIYQITAEHARHVGHHPEYSPLRWHLGHIGMFESQWICQELQQKPAVSEEFGRLFNPRCYPKDQRHELPGQNDIVKYLDKARAELLSFLESCNLSNGDPRLRMGFIFHLILEHEYQHQETMLLIMEMIDHVDKTRPGERAAIPSPAPLPSERMLAIPGGRFRMGASSDRFAYDNETPAFEVELVPYRIDAYPVTNGEFLEFLQSGGYETSAFWTPEGWEWKKQQAVEHPRHWFLSDSANSSSMIENT